MRAVSPEPDATTRGASDGTHGTMRRLLEWVWRPTDWMEEPHVRRQARIHAIILVVLIPLAGAAMVYGLIDDWDQLFRVGTVLGQTGLVLGGLAALVVSFLLLRSGRARAAAVVTVLTTFLVVWGLWRIDVASGAPGNPLRVLHYLALPVLLASMILDVRKAAVVLAVNLAGTIVLPLRLPAVGLASEAHMVTFVGLVSAISLTLAFLLYRETQTLQAQAYRLSEAGRHRMESINALAHDVASPLTPVKTQLYLLSQDPADEGRVATGLMIVDRNVRHVEELLADWRAVAEAESGRLRMQIETVDVGQLVRDVAADLASTARAGGVQLEARAGPGGLEVRADPRRMREVVYNLLTNAIKYSPGGGQAEAVVERVDDRVRVEVHDTGLGIPPGKLGLLFQPFSQVHDPKAVPVKSTGLGLYVSRQIVEAHGGRIGVRSEGVGQGSTFSFEVPTSGAAAAAGPEPADDAPAPPGDEDANRVWRALTRPSPHLPDAVARRARLLAGLLVVMVPATAISLAYYEAVSGTLAQGPSQGTTVDVLVMAGMLAAYALSRTQHARWGALTLLVTATVALWAFWYQGAAHNGGHELLFFLPVLVMLAVPFVSLWPLVAGAAANLAVLFLIDPLAAVAGVPAPPGPLHASLVTFYVLFGGLSVAAFSLTNQNQEELSRRAEAIEWADQARTLLSRRIVQTLETPLRRLREQMPAEGAWRALTVDERKQRFAEAQALVRDVEHLIDDLKELAKLDAGRVAIVPEAVDLLMLHENAVRLLGPVVDRVPADLHLGGETARVWADPTQTVKALVYLLRFAIRHANDVDSVRAYGSPGTLRADWRLLVPEPRIGPEAVDRHLTPLTALMQDDGKADGRIDLGLYVAKRILELENASLAFHWSAGGTKVRIEVGMKPAEPEATRTAADSA